MQNVNVIHITYVKTSLYTSALSSLLLFKIDDAHVREQYYKRLKNETQF